MAVILTVIRNTDRAFTYYDLRPSLIALFRLCYTLNMDKRRKTLESMVKRGDGLIVDRVDPGFTLQIYTNWIPDPRFQHAAALRAQDRLAVQAMWKAQGGGSKQALLMALQGGGAGAGTASASAFGASTLAPLATPSAFPALPFYSTAPPAVVAPSNPGVSLGSLTLPLSAAAASATTQQRKQGNPRSGGGGRGGGKKGGKGRAHPPGVPTPQAAQARTDYNNQLKALQQAALPHPGGYHCSDCAANNRNSNHQAFECAYAECNHCQRGGHRMRHCQFPKFP